jgi:hypothetical protein
MELIVLDPELSAVLTLPAVVYRCGSPGILGSTPRWSSPRLICSCTRRCSGTSGRSRPSARPPRRPAEATRRRLRRQGRRGASRRRVFALRPAPGVIAIRDLDYRADEAGNERLQPVWYLRLRPDLVPSNMVGRIPVCLTSPDPPHDPDSHVGVLVVVDDRVGGSLMSTARRLPVRVSWATATGAIRNWLLATRPNSSFSVQGTCSSFP